MVFSYFYVSKQVILKSVPQMIFLSAIINVLQDDMTKEFP